jgi:four helix bundle protein
MNQLHHEKLEVYQLSIQFLALVSELITKIPRGYGELKDQLKRSSLSIPLNISEGYGKFSPADRARFYDIAKGSSHESAAIFDVCKVLEIINDQEYNKGKSFLYRIVCMLVKLCQSQKN